MDVFPRRLKMFNHRHRTNTFGIYIQCTRITTSIIYLLFSLLIVVVFVLLLWARLSLIYPGLGECMPKIYIFIRFTVKYGAVQQLVCAKLAWFSSRTACNVCPSFTDGMVSSSVHPIQSIHCHQYTAWSANFRCWAGNTNCFAAKEKRLKCGMHGMSGCQERKGSMGTRCA